MPKSRHVLTRRQQRSAELGSIRKRVKVSDGMMGRLRQKRKSKRYQKGAP